MRIESITLTNIRSYKHCTVHFPTGITLLAGDIGSGKSTILLAIEFALFGISRSDLPGAALLRHDCNEGKVRLSCTIQGVLYTIERTLRRSTSTIVQDTGFLIRGDAREALTPSELRARVYTLLGYPQQFLAKQRNILFRSTIYTPQEEMKLVLAQSSEERIETVRRLFGIDAYRAARENAHLVARALKEREAQREAVLVRMQAEYVHECEAIAKEPLLLTQKETLRKELHHITTQLSLAEKQVEHATRMVASLASERQALAMRQRTITMLRQELALMQETRRKRAQTLQQTEQLIQQLRATLSSMEPTSGEDATASSSLQSAQQDLELARKEEGRVLALIEQSSRHLELHAGSICPTCKQHISTEHLEEVHAQLRAQQEAAKKKHDKIQLRITQLRSNIAQAQATIEKERSRAELRERLSHQEKRCADDKENVQAIDEMMEKRQAHLAEQEQAPQDATLAARATTAEQTLLESKHAFDTLRTTSLDIERRLARIEQEFETLRRSQEKASALEQELRLTKDLAQADSAKRDWLTRQFAPFASTLERHMLYAIHHHFDAALREWFARLIEDEAMSARLDHEFCALVTQGGFEIDTTHLSGGERTSVSLAWRLALVHTIHAMLPMIGTAGCIILDEPTDGFSAEQLERVRDVLREVNMEQILIVSHEQQLEGFVDHILRVRKTGGGSVVEQSA